MALPKLTPVPELLPDEQLPEASPAPRSASAPVASAPSVALAVAPAHHSPAPLALAGAFASEQTQIQAAFDQAGVDLGSAFGLMNMGGALDALGSRLPVLAIEYLANKEAKDAGLQKGLWTFRHTLEQAETVRAIFAAAKLQRIWRPKYDPRLDEQPEPWCYSQDGAQPTAHGTNPQRGPCARCPKAQWGRDSAGKRTPPECAEHQIVMLLVRDFDDPVQVAPMVTTFKRTSIGPYRLAMDTIRGRALQWGRDFPPALRNLSVEATLGVADEQTYFKPTIGAFGPVKPEEGAQLAQIVAAALPAFRDLDLMALDAEHEDASDTTSTPFDSPAQTSAAAGPRRF